MNRLAEEAEPPETVAENTVRLLVEDPPPPHSLARDLAALRPGARHFGQVLEGIHQSAVDMQRTIDAGVLRHVEEGLLEFVLSGLAEPVTSRHSALFLDSLSQSLHGRGPVCHTVGRHVTKCGVRKMAEVRSDTVE